MFPLALVTSLLAALSLASPVVRQTPVCPWNGVPNASNFTLLSVSRADNSVRKPLALGSNGLPSPSSAAWLGTADLVGVSDPVATENGWLSFLLPDEGVTITPAEVYCELFNTSPHGTEFPFTLAVNGGDSDNFSLCKSSTSDEYVVIYNVVQASSEDAGAGRINVSP
ncbi:hypothetical protein EDB87DRAFT_1685025 [Lactarius vividus]|nr:hypothetical protein EDB87DRAFT_1685025 [Lactarius vividus]